MPQASAVGQFVTYTVIKNNTKTHIAVTISLYKQFNFQLFYTNS